jgi:hypothetical protein
MSMAWRMVLRSERVMVIPVGADVRSARAPIATAPQMAAIIEKSMPMHPPVNTPMNTAISLVITVLQRLGAFSFI